MNNRWIPNNLRDPTNVSDWKNRYSFSSRGSISSGGPIGFSSSITSHGHGIPTVLGTGNRSHGKPTDQTGMSLGACGCGPPWAGNGAEMPSAQQVPHKHRLAVPPLRPARRRHRFPRFPRSPKPHSRVRLSSRSGCDSSRLSSTGCRADAAGRDWRRFGVRVAEHRRPGATAPSNVPSPTGNPLQCGRRRGPGAVAAPEPAPK